MELRTLKYFVVVAEELNITKAAKILNMSQPPLTYQMKNLEYELNTTLFTRGKRHLELTETGKLLYRRAKDIINLEEKTKNEIISYSKGITGTINIGLVEGMAPDIAADWFSDFIAIYPNIKFRILDGNSDDLIEKLRTGLISLAVITNPYDQLILNGFKVGSERLCALMSKSHPLASKEGSITIKDLINEPLITPSRKEAINTISKWFRNYNTEPTIVCEMDSYLDACALAQKNMGISIYPLTSYIPNDNIVLKPIEGEDKKFEYIFVWRKGKALPSIEERFIDFIKQKIK